MKKRLLILCFFALLAGCASSGVRVTEAQTSGFVKGETSKSDVLNALGKPTSQLRMSDGTSTLIYSYSEISTRPATFIPYIGLFVGGADTRSNSVILKFDKNDKLLEYASSDSEMGTGMGFSSGGTSAVENQPRK